MSSLADRLGHALRPRYEVQRKLAGGGMAVVFEGHDPALERQVAIKVLRPEHATARGAARFIREARTMARLGHPNVVAVHEVGEADGLFYLVMDYVEGPTLRERLAAGPLATDATISLGLDLLAALGAAHAHGVIHRDVKPANIFLLADRAVLADFGIAKVETTTEEEGLTRGGRPGTLGYMAPEQALGEEVTPRSDLWAVGAVLYESVTGRKWSAVQEPEEADWSGTPARLGAILRRALQRSPGERWSDAEAFRDALARADSKARLAPLVAGGLVAAVGLAAFLVFGVPGGGDEASGGLPPANFADLAVLPCRSASPADSTLGEVVARSAYHQLEGSGLTLTPHHQAFRWAKRGEGEISEAAAALRAAHVTDCRIVHGGGGLRLFLDIVNASGATVHRDEISGADEWELSDALARKILAALHPRARELADRLEGHPLTAVKAFFDGEADWERDARRSAEAHFANAVRLDSSFALARWRLADIRRWTPAPPGENLDRLYQLYAADLPPLDRRLLEARIAPTGPEQFALYERILEDYPLDAYATLLYGDELLHRGALWGVPPDSALAVLELAARKDSFLAPAFDHLAQARIRAGRPEAAETLARLLKIYAGPEEDPFPMLWLEAYRERFEPRSAGRLEALFDGPAGEGMLALAARYPLSLNLPHTQRKLAGMLVERVPAGLPQRTSGHVGAGVAAMALGRPAEAFREFDAAARNHGRPAARLQAAQWRVIPQALGLPGVPPEEVAGGREALREAVADPRTPAALQAEAAWSLSLALESDPEAAAWSSEALEHARSAGETDLEAFLRALESARAGRFRQALDRSAPLLAYDSLRRERHPFLRAALYTLRGTWYERLGRPDSALVAWGWHEHMDLGGVWHVAVSDQWSTLPPAGEVDWAVGTAARLRRADLLAELGRDPEVCALLAEVLRFWDDPEPAVVAERDRAAALSEERCRSG